MKRKLPMHIAFIDFLIGLKMCTYYINLKELQMMEVK